MTGFDKLRRELRDATERNQVAVPGDDAAVAPVRGRDRFRLVRRRGHRGFPVLVLAVVFGLGAGAYGAVRLLDRGEPVPAGPAPQTGMSSRGSDDYRLLPLRVEDPAGGLPWGLSSFRPHPGVVCLIAGRVQGNELGVIGRDGTFANDGRFHPLDPASSQSGLCGGAAPGGRTFLEGSAFTVPASGYSGSPETRSRGVRVAGCSNPVERPAAGQRVCAIGSLRQVKYGFAGPLAQRITLSNRKLRIEQRPSPKTSGAYVFVYRAHDAAGGGRMQLTTTYKGGIVCTETSLVGMTQRQIQAQLHTRQPGCSPPPGLR